MMKTETRNGVERLDQDGIESVFIEETLSGTYPRHEYAERPSRYMVQLVGEKRKRRVYAQPIGNVAVLYLKTKGKLIYCESAVDAALYRRDNGE